MILKFIKYKYLWLCLVLLLMLITLYNIQYLEIKTDFSQFLPENDSELTFYNKIKSELNDDENILMLSIKSEKSIFNKQYLNHVNQFTDSIRQINNIKKITGLTNLKYSIKTFFGLVQVPYLKNNNNDNYQTSKRKIYSDFDLTKNFVNKEGTILFYWIELNNQITKNQTHLVLNEIKKHQSLNSELETYLIGRKYLEYSFNNLLTNEIKNFVFWVLIFLFFTLFIIYKSPIAIIFPLVLIVISLIIFLGLLAILGRPLGIMANLFPTIILIVGVSDVIHMSTKYAIEQNKGFNSITSTRNTIKEIGVTTFITSFTTAIGFYVLYFAPMKALRDFGIEAGSAVLLTFGITLFLAPFFFTMSKKHAQFELNKRYSDFSTYILHKFKILHKYPKTILFSLGIILLISTLGILKINTNNLQLSNIPNESELIKNYNFINQNAGGSRAFELILTSKSNHVLNEKSTLNDVYKTHNYLDSLHFINFINSPILFYKYLHKMNNSSSDSLSFLRNDKLISKYSKQLNTLTKGNLNFNKEHTIYKFTGRMKDVGRHTVEDQNELVLKHINSLIDTSKIEARISGMDFLIDRAHEERIKNMFYGLGFAIFIVAVTLGIIFRNWLLMLLALMLNFIPVYIAAGILGFTNLELRGATSIIFTIGFVIAVDDTIHFLSKFNLGRKEGKNIEDALKNTFHETGTAILTTSLILIGGFFILMHSDFLEIFTLGFIVSVIVLITLFVDLVITPILIEKWFKKNS